MRHRMRGDAGMSMVEMLVAMVVTGVFLTVSTAGVVSVAGSTRRQGDQLAAQESVRQAFLLLDKQLRYADAVSSPATAGGVQWIEWRAPDPTLTTAQSLTRTRCYQWSADSGAGLLRFRSWPVPGGGAVATPAWRTVARGLTVTSQPVFTVGSAALAAAPFSVPQAAIDGGEPRVRVGVAITVTTGSPARRAGSSTVFTALNSASSVSSVCTEVTRA